MKKGCVNLSLKDSGTKSRMFLRVLIVFALVAALFVMTGAVALAGSTEDADVSAEQVDDSKFSSGFSKLAEDATLNERLMYGFQVAGIGMVVVFLVLIIIMAILYLFKLVAASGGKKTTVVPAAAPAPTVTASTATPASASNDEETVVAVATAAIAASRGASSCAFKVISITKIQ